MKDNGIDCRQIINPVHQADHFNSHYSDSDFPNAISALQQSVYFPNATILKNDLIKLISNNVKIFHGK